MKIKDITSEIQRLQLSLIGIAQDLIEQEEEKKELYLLKTDGGEKLYVRVEWGEAYGRPHPYIKQIKTVGGGGYFVTVFCGN